MAKCIQRKDIRISRCLAAPPQNPEVQHFEHLAPPVQYLHMNLKQTKKPLVACHVWAQLGLS